MEGDEFSVVEALARRYPLVGDDAAVVEGPSGALLLAADAVVEGVDFADPWTPEDVGRRAALANLSDIAAMGGRPGHLLVTVVGPAGTDALAIVAGAAAEAAVHGATVAGGDLSATTGPLVVAIAITGTIDAGAAVLRSGARPGDVLYATGAFGAAAAAGYRFDGGWAPHARVDEGEAARLAGATAMIDVSDGLSADVGHLLDASGVGCILEHVPVAPGATEDQALGGGDDYELVFTLPESTTAPTGSIRIGRIVADPTARPPAVAGWQHSFS